MYSAGTVLPCRTGNFGYVRSYTFFNLPEHNFYRFTQQPPDIDLTTESYTDKSTNWNADIHMISTYAFLSNEEAKVFAAKEQKYLICKMV